MFPPHSLFSCDGNILWLMATWQFCSFINTWFNSWVVPYTSDDNWRWSHPCLGSRRYCWQVREFQTLCPCRGCIRTLTALSWRRAWTVTYVTEAKTPSAARPVLWALGCMRELGLAQKLCLILWLKIIVVEIPENWGNLGLVNTDGITVPSYTVS